jgi:hypothetical protein
VAAFVTAIGMNFSIWLFSLCACQSFLLFDVWFFVKVWEKEQKHDAMETNPHHESFGIFAVGYPKKLELMGEDSDKLNLVWREWENGGFKLWMIFPSKTFYEISMKISKFDENFHENLKVWWKFPWKSQSLMKISIKISKFD